MLRWTFRAKNTKIALTPWVPKPEIGSKFQRQFSRKLSPLSKKLRYVLLDDKSNFKFVSKRFTKLSTVFEKIAFMSSTFNFFSKNLKTLILMTSQLFMTSPAGKKWQKSKVQTSYSSYITLFCIRGEYILCFINSPKRPEKRDSGIVWVKKSLTWPFGKT